MSHHVWWAGLASRAHLIYGASWLRQLTGDIQVSVFPPRQFLDAPQLTLTDVEELAPPNVTIRAWDAQAPVPRADRYTLLSVGAVGVKPYLRLRRRVGLRQLPVVVTDEGFGTYGNWAARRQAWQRQGVREPWRSIRTLGVTTASALLTTQRWLLHRLVDGKWQVNRHIAAEFQQHAQRTESTRQAVFLTQPWPELGVLDESAYLAHIEQVAAACADVGFPFVVHPHPAEPAHRYQQWHVHQGQGLAELDVTTVNAGILLGASSTAMLNLAAIHGVPTMRVAFPEFKALESHHSPKQHSLLHHHLGAIVPSHKWRAKLCELGPAKSEKP